jgi:pimeloyl-[acyl-carrier protein] methyl ester esterase
MNSKDNKMAIVLLPGLDGMGELFAPFVNALGPQTDAIVVSYPADQALDYQALEHFARTHLPVGRSYFLLGESFSGPIAIALAASRPEGLIGLVLCATFARNPHPYFSPFKALIRLLPLKSKLRGLISWFMFGKFADRQTLSVLERSLERVSLAALRMRLCSVLDVDYSARLAQMNVPILYLLATDDRIVFGRSCRHIARLLPAVTVVPLEGPHLLLQARPDVTAQMVGQFMRRVSDSNPPQALTAR